MKKISSPMQYGDRIERLHQWGRKMKIDLFLLTSPASLPYYSGYYFYFEHGPSPFQLLPALFITGNAVPSTLLLADNETFSPGVETPLHIHRYSSYTYREPLNFANNFISELISLVGITSPGKMRVGIEKNNLPLIVSETLTQLFSSIQWIDVSDFINDQRSIKDADEIKLIRNAAVLCDAGQQALLDHLDEGDTELDLFSKVKNTINLVAGTRVPLMADLVSGKRTADGGGIPSSRLICKGDLILTDLTPCLNGYWGDCCNTVSAGKSTIQQKKDFDKIKEGLCRAIDMIRPGVRACDIDSLLRSHVSEYPHHSGHGVGTMSHEEPRITPYNKSELQAGMIIALEPAIYRDDYGLRLEHLILVNSDGAEVLTKFDHQMEPQ